MPIIAKALAKQVVSAAPSLTQPDTWNPGEATDLPSPALTGTLSPSDGEGAGVKGLTSIPWSTEIQACGSGVLRP